MGYGYCVADGARTVMTDIYDDLPFYSDYEDEWEAAADYRDAYHDLIGTIRGCCGKAWSAPRLPNMWRNGHPGGLVIMQSALHELLLEEDRGGYGYAYISVQPREDLIDSLVPLARHNLDAVADKLFAKVQSGTRYKLRVPMGYVSAPYVPARVATR